MKNRLKEIREENGVSQKQLSKKLDMNYQVISCYETGYRDLEKASLERIVDICEALGCKAKDLFLDERIRNVLDGN